MSLEMEEGTQFDVIPNGVYHVEITDTEENVKLGEWDNRNRITVTVLDGNHIYSVINRFFGRLSTGSLLNTEVLTKAGIVLEVGMSFDLSDLIGYRCDITVVTKKTTKGGTFSNIIAWDNFVSPTKSQSQSKSPKQKHISGKETMKPTVEPMVCTQCGERIMPNSTYHVDENGNMFHDQYGKRCRDTYVKSLEKAKETKGKVKK